MRPREGEIVCRKRECTQGLPAGPYDSSDCRGKEVGEWCTVTCVAGYRPAPSLFRCKETGFFDGEAAACVPLLCDSGSKLQGTGVNNSECDGRLAGEACNVTCSRGFVGTASSAVCGLDGTFSGRAPACTRRPCVLPAGLSSASISHSCAHGGSVVSDGQTCTAACAEGYSGPLVDLLCSAPDLVGSLPTCQAKTCSKNLPRGLGLDSSQCNGKATGEVCELRCMRGYQSTTSQTQVTCLARGEFSRPGLACVRRPCMALATLPGFDASALDASLCTGKVFGEECTVTCAAGYQPEGQGSQALRCDAAEDTMGSSGGFVNASGAPASLTLRCNPRICTVDLPRKRGVLHDCDCKGTAQNCTVWRHPAFRYDEDHARTLVCGAKGAFMGSTPSVVPSTCPVPVFPEGVSNTCANRTINMTCWTYCQGGYDGNVAGYECILDDAGNLSLVARWPVSACTDVRSRRLAFKQHIPRRLAGDCDADAGAAGLTTQGLKQDCIGKATGETCIVECSDGYNISGSPSVFTCSAGGNYSGHGLPTCTARPCTTGFPDGLGVVHNCSGVVTQGLCSAQCGAGYTGSASQFTCQGTGELLGSSPTCQARPCRALALSPAYRTMACGGKVTGDTCIVDCADGWTLEGGAGSYTCQPSGNFSGTPPQCNPKACTQGLLVGSDLSVEPTCSGLRTSQTCTVACAQGYFANASVCTCTAAGTLDGAAPSCTPQVCPNMLASPQGVAHTCSATPFGSTCEATCKVGYKLRAGSSTQVWQCAWDNITQGVSLRGSWPVCDPLPCLYNFPAGSKLVSNCSGIGTDGVCESSCAPGYAGTPQLLTCGSDATLHGATPTCMEKTCPDRTVPQVQTSCQSQLFGSSCFATCAQGYTGAATSWNCAINSTNLGFTLTLYGRAPTCSPDACIYNFPIGTEYAHDCEGITSDGECTVACAAPFEGAQQTFTCLPTGGLNGTLPACVRATSTSTRSMTATMTRTVAVVAATISGGLTMSVANPAEFIADPQVPVAIASSIAALVALPTDYVSVVLMLSSRRLLSTRRLLRRLSSVVLASYTISLPFDSQADLSAVASSVQASIRNCSTDEFTVLIMNALADIGDGVYNVTVQEVSEPVFENATADDGTASVIVSRGGSSAGLSSGGIATLVVLCTGTFCCCSAGAACACFARRKARRQHLLVQGSDGELGLDPVLPTTVVLAGHQGPGAGERGSQRETQVEAWADIEPSAPGPLSPRAPSKSCAPALQLPEAGEAAPAPAPWAGRPAPLRAW